MNPTLSPSLTCSYVTNSIHFYLAVSVAFNNYWFQSVSLRIYFPYIIGIALKQIAFSCGLFLFYIGYVTCSP